MFLIISLEPYSFTYLYIWMNRKYINNILLGRFKQTIPWIYLQPKAVDEYRPGESHHLLGVSSETMTSTF